MSQQSLTPLISNPEIFSAGLLQRNFITPWDQTLSNGENVVMLAPGMPVLEPRLTFRSDEITSGANFFFLMAVNDGATSFAVFPEFSIKQIECLKLLLSLPTEALDEAYETLLDMDQFYLMRNQASNLLSATSTAKSVSIPATIGRVYQREEIYPSEDSI